jgi:diguanylate cyclase (GGDEF)-like protein/PAS domain S-box-containing protein
MSKPSVIRTKQDRFADLFMGFVLLISLLAAIGWIVNMPILASYSRAYLPMAPGTALIFLGLWGSWGIGRVISTKGGMKIVIQAIQWGLMVIVILLAFRAVTGLGPDLETIIYPNPPLMGQITTGRMSPLAALGFFLAIPALLIMTTREPDQREKSATAGLGLVLFVLSSLILLGYLYGAPFFYGGTTIPVALPSALSFWFLSLGLLMMGGPASWPVSMYMGHSLRVRLMRALVPTLVLIILFQGLLSSAFDPWISNPALKVAFAALIVTLIVIIIISIIVKNLSAVFEKGRLAEAALEKSEAELRALFASMKDVVIVYDIDGRYIEIAPTDPSNLYRPPNEMLGKTVLDILPKEQADYNIAMIREAIQKGKVVTGEYALQIGNKEIWFAASTSRLSETTAILVAHDITARKQAEQELYKLNLAVNDSSEAVFMTDREGVITFANPGFTRLYGYSPDEIVGKTTPRILKSGFMKEEDYTAFWKTLLNKEVVKGELINKTKEGRLLHIDGSANPIINQQEEIIGFLGIQHDISERKRLELVQNAIFRITQAAINSKEIDAFYRSIHTILGELVPAANFYIALHDPETGSISFPYLVDQSGNPNPPSTPILGLTGYVIRTELPLLVTPEIHDRLVQTGEVERVGTIGEEWMGAPLKVEDRVIGVMEVQSYSKGIHFNQGDLSLLEFISTQVAQTIERKRMEQEIVNLSEIDELTGLYNRRGFTLLAEQEMKLAYRFKRSVLLFFFDLDNLKAINDTLGHPQGDLALKEVGAILKEVFREADISARFGGDEFVVLAPDATMETGDLLKKRIQASLERRNQQDERLYNLTLSMGIAHFDPESPCDISELINRADEQMYQQKKEKKEKKKEKKGI